MSKSEKKSSKPKASEIERGSIATSVFISKSLEETVSLSSKVYETLSKGSKGKKTKKSS